MWVTFCDASFCLFSASYWWLWSVTRQFIFFFAIWSLRETLWLVQWTMFILIVLPTSFFGAMYIIVCLLSFFSHFIGFRYSVRRLQCILIRPLYWSELLSITAVRPNAHRAFGPKQPNPDNAHCSIRRPKFSIWSANFAKYIFLSLQISSKIQNILQIPTNCRVFHSLL